MFQPEEGIELAVNLSRIFATITIKFLQTFTCRYCLKSMRKLENKGFTLLEIVIALGSLLIFLSLAMVGYNSVVDKARRKICETNLHVLTTAIEYYGLEYDALPATLGDLRRDHFERAFARVMQENPWSYRLYGAVANLDLSGESHAAFLTYDNLKAMTTREHFNDPADSNGGISYGINASIRGRKWSEIGLDVVIVADSDNYVFNGLSDLVKRHRRGVTGEHLAMGLTKGKELFVFSENATTGLSSNLSGIITYFDKLLISSLDSSVVDKAEDVSSKLWTAINELSKTTPDTTAAISNIEGARANLQAMINDGLIDPVTGTNLLNQLQTISSQI